MTNGVQLHPRYRTSAPVAVELDNGAIAEHMLEDVSLGGAFVRMSTMHRRGALVRMHLRVGEAPSSIPLSGRIVHVLDGARCLAVGRAPGVGVEFEMLEPAAEHLLRAFVDALAEEEQAGRAVEVVRAPLVDVRYAAEELIDRVARLDGFAAIGLPSTASAHDVSAAVNRLRRLFTGAHAHAADVDRALLERATTALRDVEQTLLARIDR